MGVFCFALFIPAGCDLGYVYNGEYEYRLYDKVNDAVKIFRRVAARYDLKIKIQQIYI